MMFSNKLAIAIKTNGQVLREHNGDTVSLPFGSEYSIFVKNLNSKRALVHITIDGKDVVPGGLAVDASSEIELSRSVVNNNLSEGNCFKFIERTSMIEQHRGIKIDDGLVRVSFKYEATKPPLPVFNNTVWGGGLTYPPGARSVDPVVSSDNFYLQSSSAINCNAYSSTTTIMLAQAARDVGITVPGSLSSQQFTTVSTFVTEAEEHVMVLRLIGELASGIPVATPVTVKVKKQCESCGKVSKAGTKYCPNCGTSLEVIK